MKKLLYAIFALLLLFPAYARADDETLTSQQIERVKALKALIEDVDQESLRQTVEKLEISLYPEENLQILEAMAKTYVEIVREQNVEKQKNKEWLHSMISLNMAYLQFGGSQDGQGNVPLNRLIRRKLKEHLSAELLHHPDLFRPFKYDVPVAN